MTSRPGWRRIGMLIVLTVFVACLGALQTPALAQTPGGTEVGTGAGDGSWSFRPLTPQGGPGRNWFVLDLQPGQVVRDSVVLTNPTTQPISFRLYSADAINTPEGGAFAIRDADAERTDMAAWITMAADAYTVQAGQQLIIPFEIRVPPDAAPGDHVGAMAAANVNPESVTQSDGVDIGIKRVVGIRVYGRVAGPLNPQLSVDDVNLEPTTRLLPFLGRSTGSLEYTVTNTGNVTLTPQSTAKVTGPFGGTVAEFADKTLPEVLPGQSVTVREEFANLPPTGPLTAKILVTGGDVIAAKETSVLLIPWLAVLLLLLALAVLVFLLIRRRQNRPSPPEGAPPAGAGSRDPELARS